MIDDGDFGCNVYTGTTVHHIAHEIYFLAGENSIEKQPGFPKVASSVPRPGADPVYNKNHKSKADDPVNFVVIPFVLSTQEIK